MLKKHFGVEDELHLWEKLGVDKIIHVTPSYKGPSREKNEDIWGVRYTAKAYEKSIEMYPEVIYHPLQGLDTIQEVEKNYTFPKVEWFDFSEVKRKCTQYPDYAIQGGYMAPFYIYNNIRGLEKSLMDLVVNREYAHYIIEKICDFLYSFHQKFFETAGELIDIAEVTDDFGTQRSLMISNEIFDEFFKDSYQRLIKLVKRYGIKVFHHDDGAIRSLIPTMVKLGIDVLNPVQWRLPGMNPEELKKDFGEKLCFHGGIDNQKTLPFGTPEDVKKEVIYLLDTLASDGTGYIVAPCHVILPNTPVENIVALYETVHNRKST